MVRKFFSLYLIRHDVERNGAWVVLCFRGCGHRVDQFFDIPVVGSDYQGRSRGDRGLYEAADLRVYRFDRSERRVVVSGVRAGIGVRVVYENEIERLALD